MVKAIPQGFGSVTPFLHSNDPDGLIAFMKEGIGAKEVYVLRGSNGKAWHAQMQIGDSMVLVGDTMGKEAPRGSLYLYLEDTDAAYEKAIAAGAASIMKPDDQFYGDRNAGVSDKWGNSWWFATHVEDVSNEEIEKRARAFEQKQAAQTKQAS